MGRPVDHYQQCQTDGYFRGGHNHDEEDENLSGRIISVSRNAASMRLAEFSISSIDMKMTNALRFTKTPTTPIAKSAEQKKI